MLLLIRWQVYDGIHFRTFSWKQVKWPHLWTSYKAVTHVKWLSNQTNNFSRIKVRGITVKAASSCSSHLLNFSKYHALASNHFTKFKLLSKGEAKIAHRNEITLPLLFGIAFSFVLSVVKYNTENNNNNKNYILYLF